MKIGWFWILGSCLLSLGNWLNQSRSWTDRKRVILRRRLGGAHTLNTPCFMIPWPQAKPQSRFKGLQIGSDPDNGIGGLLDWGGRNWEKTSQERLPEDVFGEFFQIVIKLLQFLKQKEIWKVNSLCIAQLVRNTDGCVPGTVVQHWAYYPQWLCSARPALLHSA